MDTDRFFTSSKGTGGRIKKLPADFKVREVSGEKTCEIIVFNDDSSKNEYENNWPQIEPEKDQLVLTMEKFNLDQNNAVRIISRILGTSQKRIGYAGMKDKRAISSQRISIWNPSLERLKNFRSRYIALREPEWSGKRVELGDLLGNEFEITIREIVLEKNETEKTIRQCFADMEKGIPNYFGSQRFGGIRAITHLVGKELLSGNLETGIMLYLTATAPEEDTETKNARTGLAATKDFSAAAKNFPNRLRYERSIIHHLCKYPHDFAGSFQKLPKKLRIMFSHALQSHLFNKVIEKRIKAGIGLSPEEGDILENGIPTAPLYGFESILAKGKTGEIEKEVLEEEGISLEFFKTKKISELSSKGKRKAIALFPQKMKLLKVEEDEMNKGMTKARISFFLPKGNYATTVLSEIMKQEPR